MLIVGDEKDRTGTTLDHDDSLIVIEVIQKAKDEDVYQMQNYVKGDRSIAAGPYLITTAQLEAMIVGYETGLWIEAVPH